MNEYHGALVFTKKGNLRPFYESKLMEASPWVLAESPWVLAEREIQCVVLYRRDNEDLRCLIKCPINPLPVKGEFTAPSLNVVKRWFLDNGWTHKATIPV